MSHVADVIVACSVLEEEGEDETAYLPAVEALNAWLRLEVKCHEKGLVRVDGYAGGHKSMQCVVCVGAFNYLHIPGFLEAASAAPWQQRDWVQIMIKDEHDDLFTVYRPGDKASEQHGGEPDEVGAPTS